MIEMQRALAELFGPRMEGQERIMNPRPKSLERADSVEIKDGVHLSEQLRSDPEDPSRAERVQQIKSEVLNGSYQVDLQQVAKRLLGE